MTLSNACDLPWPKAAGDTKLFVMQKAKIIECAAAGASTAPGQQR